MVIGIALLTATTGCADTFGIDDPALDTCADGACDGGGGDAGRLADATLADATVEDATEASVTIEAGAEQDSADVAEGETDAADGAPPPGWQGVRCGAGTLRCTGATPACCETFSEAGAAYACVPPIASACSGYPIECGSAAECLKPNDVCCHYPSGLKCEPSGTCASTALACDPAVDGGCPPGNSCKSPALNEGQPSPYFTCAP